MNNIPYNVVETCRLEVEDLLFSEENGISGTFQDVKDNIDKLASMYGDDTKVLLEIDYDSTYIMLRWAREPTDEELEQLLHVASEIKREELLEKEALEAKEKKEMQRLMSKYHERV